MPRAREIVRAVLLDLAIAFDPARRRCDLVYQGRGLAFDTTPVTPMLISLGSDRRAEPDDALPDTVTEGSIGAGINKRRGWAGDALDPDGARIGSRLWQLERKKQTDAVLADAQNYAEEALDWLAAREAVDVTLVASYPTKTAMLLAVQVGGTTQTLRLAAGAGS